MDEARVLLVRSVFRNGMSVPFVFPNQLYLLARNDQGRILDAFVGKFRTLKRTIPQVHNMF